MLLSILLMATMADVMVVSTSEPRPAEPWVETFSASCDEQHLEVRRTLYPRAVAPQVLLNGRPAQGQLRPLELELGEPAAYRLSFTCPKTKPEIHMRWVRGLAQGDGQVRYRAGYAVFRDGALVEVHAEEAEEEAFWYR